MKRNIARSLVAGAIISSIGFVLPLSTFASASTTTTTTTVANTTPKSSTNLHKAYGAKLKAIDATFVLKIDTAKSNFDLAMSMAVNSSQRITARSVLRIAIVNATLARDAALKTLSNPRKHTNRSKHSHHR